MNEIESNKKRDLSIDCIRAFSMIFIVLAHVDPPGILFQLRSFDVVSLVVISVMCMKETNGVKAYFFSNACAAYRRDVYLATGGFDAPIITNEDMIANHPDVVRRFLSATRRGYMDAIADPDGCAEVLNKFAPDYTPEMLKKSQEYLADKYMEDTNRWGEMKQSVWDNYTEFMLEYKLIPEMIDADLLYTNEFLPEAE